MRESVFFKGILDYSGQQQGDGILITQKFIFEGQCENGYVHGKGRFMHLNGTMHSGFWKNDQFDGYGEHRYPDGSFYRGNWIKG